VYVEFGFVPPLFTSELWNAATTYAPGELVYYDVTGECYQAITASTGTVPTDAGAWKWQKFPKVLARTVKLAAIADENLTKASGWDAQAELAYAEASSRRCQRCGTNALTAAENKYEEKK
jgi:hypothetical protein